MNKLLKLAGAFDRALTKALPYLAVFYFSAVFVILLGIMIRLWILQ